MLNKSLLMVTVLTPLLFSTAAYSQAANTADPACMIKSADGTQTVDKTKCPDGMKPSAAAQIPAAGTKNADDTTKAAAVAPKPSTDATKSTDDTATTTVVPSTTKTDTASNAAAAPAAGNILVSPDKMTGAKILSANDFIGQSVYSRTNEKVGKVDDIILSENGVQAVVLGVGGFLGMGTKDVAVMLSSIEISKDGNSTKLVVDANKDQLKSAPTYDPKARTYIN